MKTAIHVRKPDWRPLEAVVSVEDRAAFMYMGHAVHIVLYKHRDTRRYLNIHATTGQCYRYTDGEYVEVHRENALSYLYGSI
jgi:hypothetical protein